MIFIAPYISYHLSYMHGQENRREKIEICINLELKFYAKLINKKIIKIAK